MDANGTGIEKRLFLDMTNAASLAGFSLRHFRRIIKDEGIRRIKIGRRFFVVGSDFERWKSARGVRRPDGE
jgi:hypothetical protein